MEIFISNFGKRPEDTDSFHFDLPLCTIDIVGPIHALESMMKGVGFLLTLLACMFFRRLGCYCVYVSAGCKICLEDLGIVFKHDFIPLTIYGPTEKDNDTIF